MSLHLLTGARHSGKTTVARRLADVARARGFSVGGILAPAVFVDGHCVGYDVVDLATGRTQRLATVDSPGVEQIGPFQFQSAGLTLGRAALTAAVLALPDLVVVDEVGPLELAGQGWADYLAPLAARRALTVFAVRASLAGAVARQWNAVAQHEVAADRETVIGSVVAELARQRQSD